MYDLESSQHTAHQAEQAQSISYWRTSQRKVLCYWKLNLVYTRVIIIYYNVEYSIVLLLGNGNPNYIL